MSERRVSKQERSRGGASRSALVLAATLAALLALGLALGLARPAHAQRFLPDDPIQEDPDRMDMPAPRAIDFSDYYDTALNSTIGSGDYDGPALNVNTVGDVPRSSWYTPRHYYQPMTTRALQRGTEAALRVPADSAWQVLRLGEDGVVPTVEIADSTGARYVITFDLEDSPERATGAEAMATRLLYALGYHVPESHIVVFERDRLVTGEDGGPSLGALRKHLRGAARMADGRYRALATYVPPNETPLGPFLFHGTRQDDGNDVFAHEGRRELRGLRVVAAWLQLDGIRAAHTQDRLVREGGRLFVRHLLTGLGTAFGAGSTDDEDQWAGHEYFVDLGPAIKRALTLGFWGAPWAGGVQSGHVSVGHFEALTFDPQRWKPRYPNPAFQRMDAHDAFWAAKQIASFSDADLRAATTAAAFADANAAAYLAETLAARRDSIARAYLGLGGGLDRFRVEEGRLAFTDLLAQNDLARSGQLRKITWRPFDNQAEAAGEVLAETASAGEAFALPEATPPFLKATIHTPGRGWTHVYLRRTPGGYEVAGLEREEEHRPS